ncbi:MAG: M55 family metallopeptidase [Microbacterium sp.]
MKVYISADMEGVGTVVHREDVDCDHPSSHHYARARDQLALEVNAAAQAAFDAGAQTVTVNDSHGSMRNLVPADLHPRIELIRGPVKAGLMTAGIDETYDALVLLGYHSRAGRPGVLSHTLSGANLFDVLLNGEPIGEIGLSALSAAERGVPLVFLAGDAHACAEARELVPDVTTFATKRALDRISAVTLSPSLCREGIAAGVRAALADPPPAPAISGPQTLTATFLSATAATLANWIPGVRSVDARTVEFDAPTLSAAIDLLVVMLFAANGAADA